MQIFCKENFSLPHFFAICTSTQKQATHRLPAIRIERFTPLRGSCTIDLISE